MSKADLIKEVRTNTNAVKEEIQRVYESLEKCTSGGSHGCGGSCRALTSMLSYNGGPLTPEKQVENVERFCSDVAYAPAEDFVEAIRYAHYGSSIFTPREAMIKLIEAALKAVDIVKNIEIEHEERFRVIPIEGKEVKEALQKALSAIEDQPYHKELSR